jgi:uncharacterized protein (TIGR03435 family)
VIQRLPGGRFTAEKATLKILVKWAYELTDDELVGGPKWTDSDRYDIVATPDHDVGAEQVSKDQQIRLMVRGLLADRFKLAMQREPREISAYVLSVAKGGQKLTATTHPAGPQVRTRRMGQVRIMTFQAAPLSFLARSLSEQLHQEVVDQTNLEGTFDCKLEWAPDMSEASASSSDPGGPSIFTAIQQLGLRLRKEKVMVDVYAIGRVERPSDN